MATTHKRTHVQKLSRNHQNLLRLAEIRDREIRTERMRGDAPKPETHTDSRTNLPLEEELSDICTAHAKVVQEHREGWALTVTGERIHVRGSDADEIAGLQSICTNAFVKLRNGKYRIISVTILPTAVIPGDPYSDAISCAYIELVNSEGVFRLSVPFDNREVALAQHYLTLKGMDVEIIGNKMIALVEDPKRTSLETGIPYYIEGS